MKQYFIEQLTATPEVDGMEALGIPKLFTPAEGFGIRLSAISLAVDKFLASMNSSIHQVDYRKAQLHTKGLGYFDRASQPIPVPSQFNVKTMTMTDYVSACRKGVYLIEAFKTDSSRFYDWLRDVAAKGKVGGTFRYTITSTAGVIKDTGAFIKTLGNPTKETTIRLQDAYPSFNEMFKLMDEYNTSVKTLKGRDAEIIAKQLQLNANLGQLIIDRIGTSDIVFDEQDLDKILSSYAEFEDYMNLVGAMIGLLNELSAVFQDQCNTVLSW